MHEPVKLGSLTYNSVQEYFKLQRGGSTRIGSRPSRRPAMANIQDTPSPPKYVSHGEHCCFGSVGCLISSPQMMINNGDDLISVCTHADGGESELTQRNTTVVLHFLIMYWALITCFGSFLDDNGTLNPKLTCTLSRKISNLRWMEISITRTK